MEDYSPEHPPYEALAWAVLLQAADDRHNRNPIVRQEAEDFLSGGYPLRVFVGWLPVDVQQHVERILKV